MSDQMTEKQKQQVIADEKAAEAAYQADLAKKLAKVELDRLPHQTQQVLVQIAKDKLKKEVQKEVAKEK